MENIANKISQYTLALQSQCSLPLWSLANENVIYANAIGKPTAWGPKQRKFRLLMKIMYKLRATDFLIFCTGLLKALSIWLKIDSAAQKHNQYKRVFASFGASSEDYFFADYKNAATDCPLRINWVTYQGLSALPRPNFFSILFLIFRHSFGFTKKLQNASEIISTNIIDFLQVCAFNVGLYSFYSEYWRLAKQHGIEEVVFLTPEILAFACIDQGIKTIYVQHGLLARSILIPNFTHTYSLTKDEEKYFKRFLPSVEILRLSTKLPQISNHRNVLLLLSLNLLLEQRLPSCVALLEWAKKHNLEVVMRPTRAITSEQVQLINAALPEIQWDDINVSFEESLQRWQPKLVVSWLSTALVTALESNYLPVSLHDPGGNKFWENMIYPLQKRVLFWPKDISLIEEAMQSDVNYHTQVSCLKE